MDNCISARPFKSAILVDEMNIMGQLHSIGVKGVNPWFSFYEALESYLGHNAEKHFYCSNVPIELFPERHLKRAGFFNALKRASINVHEGFTQLDSEDKLVEKGVDVMVAMDINKFSYQGYTDIIVCSGDSDYVPAIEEAKANGAKIHVVISYNIPAAKMAAIADVVIPLDRVLKWMSSECIVPIAI
ncbi:NYN domain-containing protein [Psychrobacillus sp. FSL H8-0484]|uniref:NYN domain-containing protein n=1 Tax=Psychrobacillus sp. FSL H8-0484 TaxID=2921390 RepID=UPI0030F6AADA